MAIYFDKTTIKTGASGTPVINEGENLDSVLGQQNDILDNQDQLIEQLGDVLGTKLAGESDPNINPALDEQEALIDELMAALENKTRPSLDLSEATATAEKVLAGETFFSGVSEEVQTGIIPLVNEKEWIPSNEDQIITAGQYLSGNQIILGDSKLVVENIRSGVEIFGVEGSFTSDADATASQILSGKTAYVNGNKITGSIASKAAATYTPSTANQTIAAGQYLSGVQTVKGDANLIAANIKSGVSIFGIAGSYTGAAQSSYVATGTKAITFGQTDFTVTGLSFTPSYIMIVAISIPTNMNTYTIAYTNYDSERISWVYVGNANIGRDPNSYSSGYGYSFTTNSNGFTLSFKYLNTGNINEDGYGVDKGSCTYRWIAIK